MACEMDGDGIITSRSATCHHEHFDEFASGQARSVIFGVRYDHRLTCAVVMRAARSFPSHRRYRGEKGRPQILRIGMTWLIPIRLLSILALHLGMMTKDMKIRLKLVSCAAARYRRHDPCFA
ncbi:hypothetical protein BV20DRAFT_298650 [Pilatotrama ljubarskyi]|nr:hypothetical protein BV20DRAFT_298650 [Pilatotrama ljubarskyi]